MKKTIALKRKVNRIVNIVKTKPKKFLLKRDRATIDLKKLPTVPKKPLLSQHSKYFKNEYEKEKALLGWK